MNKKYQCNNSFYRPEEGLHYNMNEIIGEDEYKMIPPKYRKWFTEVGKPLHFYCQNLTGDVDFSIDEWNAAYNELKDLSESVQKSVLGERPACTEQCPTCAAIVGERRLKTQRLP